jgi:hypothetical protein
MTGFSVVRRLSVPSGQRPFYRISIGFFCCPPTLRPKVRHPFRILGASRTRGMTPSIRLYYMQNRQSCQQHFLVKFSLQGLYLSCLGLFRHQAPTERFLSYNYAAGFCDMLRPPAFTAMKKGRVAFPRKLERWLQIFIDSPVYTL